MSTQLRNIIASFVDTLYQEIDAQGLEEIVSGKRVPQGRDFGGYEPEAFIEDELIYPILENVLGFSKRRFPYSNDRTPTRPDFEISELDVIGENKVLNNYENAASDLEDGYLKDGGIEEEFGIATDGLKWGLIRVDTGGDYRTTHHVTGVLDLLPVAQEYATSSGLIETPPPDVNTDGRLSEFLDNFSRDGLEHHLNVAPERFRDLRQGSVEEFYDLYVELLFGQGKNQSYDTTLLDDIQSPPQSTDVEERVFAITVVNRLLFIKLLEEGNVLPTGFLADRVEDYKSSKEDLAGINLYDNQIKPIFYDLFNTPREDRTPQHRRQGSWFTKVPYLNGGLFRENIDAEREYSIRDRILPRLIYDLIEGHELESQNGLDPAVLGNVFEMTINYISGEEGRQKDIGAYYTPNDASDLVTRQTVDEVIRDRLIGVYSEYYPEIENRDEDLPLTKILRWIEDQKSWFGDPGATEEAYERLGELKILDPACGSGHFLTSAVTRLHQARVSVMRGMGWDENEDWGAQLYQAKEEVVTNSIYGVDIDKVAVEIAKLRVWLKIIEEGYKEDYGRLPNIDLNIVSGNSLIGLPVHSRSGVTLDLFRDSVDRLEELRKEYKRENEDVRGEISKKTNKVEESLDKEYVRKITSKYSFKEEINDSSEISTSPIYIDEDNVEESLSSLTFEKANVEEFSESEQNWLDRKGFTTNPAWGATARLDVEGNSAITANVIETVKDALKRGFRINKVERYPVVDDLESIDGDPFHWVANFPEVLGTDGSDGFDVIVGNPPYGKVLNDSEKVLVQEYEAGKYNDIVMPFIERQLRLLKEGGYFGNVHSMGVLYQSTADTVREMIREKLKNGRIASFGHRPDPVFKGADPRVSITTGQKVSDNGSEEGNLRTSSFILFYTEERNDAFQDIEYSSIDGLVLGNTIGDATENIAYPKVGSEMSRSILRSIKNGGSRTLDAAMNHYSRANMSGNENPDHILYRNYHPLYWPNPYLDNIYPDYGNSPPRDFEPMEFDTKVERNAAFILLQSSIFYHYWMTYENQRDMNWGPIEAFPFPDFDEIKEREHDIQDVASNMWEEMENQFDGQKIPDGARLKQFADRADDILGPLLDLNQNQISWLKSYHTEFGRAES